MKYHFLQIVFEIYAKRVTFYYEPHIYYMKTRNLLILRVYILIKYDARKTVYKFENQNPIFLFLPLLVHTLKKHFNNEGIWGELKFE